MTNLPDSVWLEIGPARLGPLIHPGKPSSKGLGALSQARLADQSWRPPLDHRVDAVPDVNAETVLEKVLARARAAPDTKTVICGLSSSPLIDLAGAKMLHDLHGELARAASPSR